MNQHHARNRACDLILSGQHASPIVKQYAHQANMTARAKSILTQLARARFPAPLNATDESLQNGLAKVSTSLFELADEADSRRMDHIARSLNALYVAIEVAVDAAGGWLTIKISDLPGLIAHISGHVADVERLLATQEWSVAEPAIQTPIAKSNTHPRLQVHRTAATIGDFIARAHQLSQRRPSQEEIAHELALSTQTVKRHWKSLKRVGFFTHKNRGTCPPLDGSWTLNQTRELDQDVPSHGPDKRSRLMQNSDRLIQEPINEFKVETHRSRVSADQ